MARLLPLPPSQPPTWSAPCCRGGPGLPGGCAHGNEANGSAPTRAARRARVRAAAAGCTAPSGCTHDTRGFPDIITERFHSPGARLGAHGLGGHEVPPRRSSEPSRRPQRDVGIGGGGVEVAEAHWGGRRAGCQSPDAQDKRLAPFTSGPPRSTYKDRNPLRGVRGANRLFVLRDKRHRDLLLEKFSFLSAYPGHVPRVNSAPASFPSSLKLPLSGGPLDGGRGRRVPETNTWLVKLDFQRQHSRGKWECWSQLCA